ncbi:MAG: sigma-54 dependent transcriptional regulator [Spirochaetota bacterium]
MSGELYPDFPILVVDDEASIVQAVLSILKSDGITNVYGLEESSAALGFTTSRDVGIVLVDLVMPVVSGFEILTALRRDRPEVSVAVITGNRELEQAVECMRAGAADYLTKPMEGSRLVATVRRLIENQELARENRRIRDRMLSTREARHPAFDAIVSADPAMEALMRYAEAIAPTSQPVLVTGETGTGKELFARALHDLGGRSGAFVAVNLAGLDDGFFTDTLFGHRAGAFTGAAKALDGLVENAKNGTPFLDEIGDLSQSSQVKLLRFLDTGEYLQLGSDAMKRSRARIIVATNQDLADEVARGSFRKDLYYRLKAHYIDIPPLRERLRDIPLLVTHFLRAAALEEGREAIDPPARLFALLSTYRFPGNVRELKAMVFDSFSRSRGNRLLMKPFQEAIGTGGETGPRELATLRFPDLLPSLRGTVDLLIAEALERSEGNQALAARLLGISPQALSKRLKRSRPPITRGKLNQG